MGWLRRKASPLISSSYGASTLVLVVDSCKSILFLTTIILVIVIVLLQLSSVNKVIVANLHYVSWARDLYSARQANALSELRVKFDLLAVELDAKLIMRNHGYSCSPMSKTRKLLGVQASSSPSAEPAQRVPSHPSSSSTNNSNIGHNSLGKGKHRLANRSHGSLRPGNTVHDIDPRYGVEKRLVPTGPNPLHN